MKLLIGGSPCTYWSIAQTKNRETEASGLGWELFKNFLIARDKFQPDYFLYENNKSMSKAIREQITEEFGFEPVCINSALVSAQNRERLYWLGKRGLDGTYSRVDVEQPEDRGILLRDILETGAAWREKGYALQTSGRATAEDMIIRKQRNGAAEEVTPGKALIEAEMEYMVREVKGGRNHFDFDYHHDATKDKSSCVTGNTHRGVPYNVLCEPVNVTADGKAGCLRATYYKDGIRNMVGNMVDRKTCVAEQVRIGTIENEATHKSNCLTTSCEFYEYCGTLDKPVYKVKDGYITIKGKQYPIKLRDGCYIIRKLTVTECKRLQTVPDEYEFPVSDTQAYKMLGNGWTVDVIAHLLGHIQGIKEAFGAGQHARRV